MMRKAKLTKKALAEMRGLVESTLATRPGDLTSWELAFLASLGRSLEQDVVHLSKRQRDAADGIDRKLFHEARVYVAGEDLDRLRRFVRFACGDAHLSVWEENFIAMLKLRMWDRVVALTESQLGVMARIEAKLHFERPGEPPPTDPDASGDDDGPDDGLDDSGAWRRPRGADADGADRSGGIARMIGADED